MRLSSILLLLAACAAPDAEPAPEWIPLFDGASLDGWTPKIAGHELGEDPYRTFRVEDGLLKVAYDGYERFDGRFGHLFFHTPFERCRLRIEYRFVGAQCAGGPGWAVRNSGVMLLCQPPETMALGQEFPVSIEAQMLGGDGEHARPTANLCTPGTHVVIGGELVTRHCVESRSPTFHGERWVVMEVEVGDVIRHRVDGEVVLEYDAPQLDPGDPDAQALLARGVGPLLHGGYVALQAESHPLEIRRVEVRR